MLKLKIYFSRKFWKKLIPFLKFEFLYEADILNFLYGVGWSLLKKTSQTVFLWMFWEFKMELMFLEDVEIRTITIISLCLEIDLILFIVLELKNKVAYISI